MSVTWYPGIVSLLASQQIGTPTPNMGITSKEVREKRKEKARAAKASRSAIQKHKEETEQKVNAMFGLADTEGVGHLDGAGVGRLLQLLNKEDGEDPLDETTLGSAVTFVFKAADKDASGGIDKQELATAIAAWNNWATTHDALGERVRAELKEIDKDFSGSLDTEELKHLLTRLNGDIDVTDELIATIIKKCDKRGNGVIDIEEVAPAITMWYQLVEKHPDTVDSSSTDPTVTSTYGTKDGNADAPVVVGKKECCIIC